MKIKKPNIETLCLDPESHYQQVNTILCIYDDLNINEKKRAKKIIKETVVNLCIYDDLNINEKKKAKKIIKETVLNLELAFLKLSKGKYKIKV